MCKNVFSRISNKSHEIIDISVMSWLNGHTCCGIPFNFYSIFRSGTTIYSFNIIYFSYPFPSFYNGFLYWVRFIVMFYFRVMLYLENTILGYLLIIGACQILIWYKLFLSNWMEWSFHRIQCQHQYVPNIVIYFT